MKIFSVLLLATAAFTAACADPAANKPKAETSAPSNAAKSSNAPTLTEAARPGVLADFKATGTDLALTPENSKVEFTVRKSRASTMAVSKSLKA